MCQPMSADDQARLRIDVGWALKATIHDADHLAALVHPVPGPAPDPKQIGEVLSGIAGNWYSLANEYRVAPNHYAFALIAQRHALGGDNMAKPNRAALVDCETGRRRSRKCPCGGSKVGANRTDLEDLRYPDPHTLDTRCTWCDGSGRTTAEVFGQQFDGQCSYCHGKGYIRHDSQVRQWLNPKPPEPAEA